ncbi:MAG: hypothetical protein ICV78_14690 [Tolypothrix sp. Co-bin9]|nr:hypothetical protein [Tolypothrix sp. Co-bin9]
MATVKADEQGFNASLTQLEVGDKISAIATVAKYGTSEPTYNRTICSPNAPKPIQNRRLGTRRTFFSFLRFAWECTSRGSASGNWRHSQVKAGNEKQELWNRNNSQ